MGKSRRGHKEFTREQSLISENKKLKRIISSLRKQLDRIDVNRYSEVKDIIQEHYAAESREEEATQLIEKLEKKWRCYNCASGILEIVVYSKAGKEYYFRQCNHCERRTPGKEYNPSVEGIIKKTK